MTTPTSDSIKLNEILADMISSHDKLDADVYLRDEFVDELLNVSGFPVPTAYGGIDCIEHRCSLNEPCGYCALKENRNHQQYLEGSYMWYCCDPPLLGDDVIADFEVLYIGKAARLKNRLQTHLYSEWLRGYWDYDFRKSGGVRIPVFCVWVCDDRATLESKLIKKFTPIFNRRRE